MGVETRRRILEKLNAIAIAVGSKDLNAFRATVLQGSVLLTNLGTWAAAFANATDQGIEAFIDKLQDKDQEEILAGLAMLQDSYIPVAAKGIIEHLQGVFPDKGGRPTKFNDHTAMKAACDQVLEYIRNGYSEADAKRFAAQKLGISPQTMHRTWVRRKEIVAETNVAEFLKDFLKNLSTQQVNHGVLDNAHAEHQSEEPPLTSSVQKTTDGGQP